MFTQYDEEGNLQVVEEPPAGYVYTYADYLKFKFEERLELFKGHIMKMSAPNTRHQVLVGKLHLKLGNFLEHKKCNVYVSPFDVRLPKWNKIKDEEITTVVQPDLCVVCDEQKIDYRGCCGAPDIMVEILSPGNTKMELQNKFDLYEEACVQKYWIVEPQEKVVLIYTLENGRFIGKKPYSEGMLITTNILPDLEINVSDIFK
ncbi:Uma2 family endonuclease [Ilyomonas limi]|uniref:Uma2 family endonuclease n=1 Tax=Ilyomonas limi TaxID=2575867 RepID=A0A4U3KR66_9BACT|nr:Uma2 family endonuclease [Ilyomonas limi]TKK64770.1 Uma2 family endonuclease [Ilyomonas limi]